MSVLHVKQQISVSEPPFGGLSGNVCDSSLARWKARSRLPTGYNSAEALIHQNRPLLKGSVNLVINIRLKVTFTTDIYTLLNSGKVLLQFSCWTFSHKLCSRFYSTEIEFY